MKILYVGNSGGGFAESKTVVDGMTIGQFAKENVCGSINNVCIRVNDKIVQESDTLSDGDVVTATPLY